jgi:hypothetical protein
LSPHGRSEGLNTEAQRAGGWSMSAEDAGDGIRLRRD